MMCFRLLRPTRISVFLVGIALVVSSNRTATAQVSAFLQSPYYETAAITQGWNPPNNHYAFDYGVTYQPIIAAADGTVIRVRWANNTCHKSSTISCDYGLHIYVQHANGYVSRYAHLSSTAFNLETTNTPVKAGQIIGTSGDTGYSTGPHLHFELRSSGGLAVDPYTQGLWMAGEPIGQPIRAPANSGEYITDDTADNTGGFVKGKDGLFVTDCPPATCSDWYRETGYGYNVDMYWTWTNGPIADYWARWSPTLPEEGRYEVFVHGSYDNATFREYSWQTPFTIWHADGQATGRVDQYGLAREANQNARWVSLGIYRMYPDNYMHTTDATGEAAGTSEFNHCGIGQYCRQIADAIKFVRRNTLNQVYWRGDQLWWRVTPIINGTPNWLASSNWLVPGSISYLPGSGSLQTESLYIVGSTLWYTLWRNGVGWYKTIPVTNGQIQWASASGWSTVSLSLLPGEGDMQTQSEYVVGNKLWQTHWRGDQGWYRTVPIVNGAPNWLAASAWSGPLASSSIAGSGSMQTQTDYVIGNILHQFHWRNDEGYYRTVPIINGDPVFPSWGWITHPLTNRIANMPGSGILQAQSDFVLP